MRSQLLAFTAAELVAVVLAIAYLILVIRQNILCWICAIVSSGIYVWLFIDAKLYMESGLYLFYVGMACYGWWVWARGSRDNDDLPVVVWPWKVHVLAIAMVVGLALLAGSILVRFTDAAFPYIDSLTTFSGVWATYLVARKVLENWWYWLLIDLASIILYWQRDLELTALLFVVYVLLIPVGLLQWRRSMSQLAAPDVQVAQ